MYSAARLGRFEEDLLHRAVGAGVPVPSVSAYVDAPPVSEGGGERIGADATITGERGIGEINI